MGALPAAGSIRARLGTRLLAFLIDLVAALVLGGGLVVGGVAGQLRDGTVGDADPLVLGGAVAFAGYAVVQGWLLATRGYTFGRVLTGIRVLTADHGRPLGAGRTLLRTLVVVAAWLVPVVGPLALALSTVASPARRGWHDRAAGAMAFDVTVGVDPLTAPPSPAEATERLRGLLGEPDRRRHRTGRDAELPEDDAPTLTQQLGLADEASAGRPRADRARVAPLPVAGPPVAAPAPGEPPLEPSPVRPAHRTEPAPQEVDLVASSPGTTRIVPPAPYEQVGAPFRALDDEVERTRLREARTKVAYAPSRAQTRPRATLLLWDNRVVVLEGTALVGRNPSPREGEALPVQVIAVVDRGRSVSKTHLALGVDSDGVWLRDRNSTNGTVVTLEDGQQILCAPEQKVRVPVGASVAFGDYWLTVAG